MVVDFAPIPTLPLTDLPAAVDGERPGYYDVPMLKAPPWRWEIASYFYLGGLSAGAYLLARLAERFGGDDPSYRDVTRAGTTIAALALAPCPPLLIKDLGDPARFHHMLRVFKPTSPMNFGAWVLTAYSGAAAVALLREWGLTEKLGVHDGLVLAVTDLAGVPLALLLAGYTGVLLSSTSTPVWSMNEWIGPLFSAGAVATGAAAISLWLTALRGGRFFETPAGRALETVKLAAQAAETVALRGYRARAGAFAEPLTRGEQALPFRAATMATWGAGLLGLLPLPGAAGHLSKTASAMMGLAGGYALRWAMVHAGKPSGNDPEAARRASRSPPEMDYSQ